MHTESGTSGKTNGHIVVGLIVQTDCPRLCKASGFSGTHSLVVRNYGRIHIYAMRKHEFQFCFSYATYLCDSFSMRLSISL